MKIGWWVLLIMFFLLTLKMGVWYGSEMSPLEIRTAVARVETEDIMLRDKVAALEVEAVMDRQKIDAMLDRIGFYDACMKKKWRNC